LYEEVKEEVEAVLAGEVPSLDGICFTTDLWSSRNSDNYQALTCHYVNDRFELRKFLVSCSPFPGRHTGQLIADRLDPEVRKLNLGLSCHRWCVNDHGSNIVVAVREMVEINTEYFCNDHTIDLVVTKGIAKCEAFAELVKKCRDLASHLHRSTLSVSQCRAKAEELGTRFTKIVQPVSTRWNSEYYSFESILKNRTVLEAMWVDGCRFAEKVPTPNEWAMLVDCLPLLAPFAKASATLSADDVPTIHLVVLLIGNIRHLLESASRHENVVAAELAEKLMRELDSRYPERGCEVIENALANVLDPRYKGVQVRKLNRYEVTKQALEQLYRDTVAESNLDRSVQDAAGSGSNSPAPDEELDYNDQLLREFMGDTPTVSVARRRSEVGLSQELELYLTTKCCPRETPILGWWRLSATTFPILARLARKILCIPASSASSERVFSSAGNIVTSRRQNLDPEMVEKLVYLKENLMRVRKN
jgi:hypothetical protein